MDNPALSRNVAVLGNIHHGAFPLPVSLEGKTLLLDMLIESTRTEPWNLSKDVRYTDTTIAEQERGISITSTPISLVLPDSRSKSHLINFLDTPGHISLTGEVTASDPLPLLSPRSPHLRRCADLHRRGRRRHAEHGALHPSGARSRPPAGSRLHQDGPTDHRPEAAARRRLLQAGGHAGGREHHHRRLRPRRPPRQPAQRKRRLLQRAPPLVLHAAVLRASLFAPPREPTPRRRARKETLGKRLVQLPDASLRGKDRRLPRAAQLRAVLS